MRTWPDLFETIYLGFWVLIFILLFILWIWWRRDQKPSKRDLLIQGKKKIE